MPKVTQLVLNLESKPGVLANVCGVLGTAGINILAFSASEASAGKGKLRLVVEDVVKAETALKAAKFRSGREDAISLTLANRPGALADAAQKLAQAKVNIKSAYATTTGEGQAGVVLTVSNTAKGLAALSA